MKIVLISGQQGSGKTKLQQVLAKAWTSQTRKPVVFVNFADILYEMHDAVLKILYEYWPPRGFAKDGPLLQLLGTQWGRETIDQDIWVKCLRIKINKVARRDVLVVVGDCRFENEFHAFPEALRIRLLCSEAVRKERCSMWRDNTQHLSEIGLDAYSDAKKFDVYFDTEVVEPDHCAKYALNMLLKDDWISDRAKS